jgi:hypothetical protein
MESKLSSLDMKELERLAEIFNKAAMEMADKDAKAPRVPSPRVSTDHKESECLHPPTPRVDMNRRHNQGMPPVARNNDPTVDAMLTMMELSNQPITPQRLASRQFPLQFLHEVAGAVMDVETGDMLEYRHLVKNPKYRETWSKAFGKEIGRLAQGQKGIVEGTDALFFIPKSEVPPE